MTFNIQLVHSSAMDPAGISMLGSIRDLFDTIGIRVEGINFVSETITSQQSMIDTIQNQKKCPAVVAARFDLTPQGRPISIEDVHVMVATGIKTDYYSNRQNHTYRLVQCKNTHRDDINQPGIFQFLFYIGGIHQTENF